MRILLAAIFLSPASLAAQTIAFLDKPYSEVPALAALQAVESGLPLQSKAGAPNGKIWLFETADGIQIVGAIDGPAPAYARSEPEFVSRDYIQVRLSLIDGKPEFDPGGLAEEDCDSSDANYALLCRQRAQAGRDAVKYLPNLFVRQWRFAPGIASETYAKLALRGRGSDFDAVRPKPRAGMMIADQSRFLITLAWQDFPLTDKLKISNIRLGVEFCPKGFGAGSADGPADPLQGLREFVLSRPREYHITECNYTLNADSPPLQIENRSFYQPGPSTLVDTTFGAFQTELDAGDGGRTPTEIESTGFAAMRIGPGEFYCNGGTYLSGTKRFALSAADAKALMDSLAGELNTHDIHNLPGGSHLVSTGMMSDEYIYEHSNTSHIGRLRDEGENRILVIFHVNPTNGISLAYQGEFEVRFEPPPEDSEKDDPTSDHNILLDGDIQISPDWRTITEYRGTGYLDDREPHLLKWSSKRFCLNGAKYQECGVGPAGPPPHPRSYPGPETLRHIP